MSSFDNYPWLRQLVSFPDRQALTEFVLKKHPGVSKHLPSKVAIIGASRHGLGLLDIFMDHGTVVSSLHDDDNLKIGLNFHGLNVTPMAAVEKEKRDLPIILATHQALALQRRLKCLGFNHVWPFPLLAVAYPGIFRPHPFYAGLHEDLFEHRSLIAELAHLLSDDLSRLTLERVIAYRLTLDAEYLADIIQPDAYLDRNLLCFQGAELMVDGGTYDGDSLSAFIERVSGKFAGIIAFEPASTPFSILRKKFGHDPRIILKRACLFSRETSILFGDSGQRDASISTTGGSSCQAISIDGLPEAAKTTFIKLNIEGAEQEALRGAANTIRTWRPKLAVAVYHLPRDLWAIARQITEITAGYRFYLRQHAAGIIETVLYAIPLPG